MRVKLLPELADAVAAYHQALENAGVNSSIADTVRELLTLGLTNAPTDSASLMMRSRAFNAVRTWVFQHIHRNLERTLDDLAREITPDVLAAYHVPPLPPDSNSNSEPHDGT